MEEKDLKLIWMKMSKATFDQFIEENIGYKEDVKTGGPKIPVCFDSGDGLPWCNYCNFQVWC